MFDRFALFISFWMTVAHSPASAKISDLTLNIFNDVRVILVPGLDGFANGPSKLAKNGRRMAALYTPLSPIKMRGRKVSSAIAVFDLDDIRKSEVHYWFGDTITSFEFFPEGDSILMASNDGLFVTHINTWEPKVIGVPAYFTSRGIVTIEFSPSGRQLILKKTNDFWLADRPLRTQKIQIKSREAYQPSTLVHFVSGDYVFKFASSEQTSRIAMTGGIVPVFAELNFDVYPLDVSQSGEWLLGAGRQRLALEWIRVNGQGHQSFDINQIEMPLDKGESAIGIRSARFSSDGKFIFADIAIASPKFLSSPHIKIVIEVASGTLQFKGREDKSNTLAMSPASDFECENRLK